MNVAQIAYSSRDVRETARAMVATDGIGPFWIARFPLSEVSYRGAAAGFDSLTVAFAYRGDQQVELVQVPEGGPSIYTEELGDRRERFHHTYHSSDEDYDALIARHAAAGEPVVYAGASGSGADRVRFCYVDARARLGHFVELVETAKMIGRPGGVLALYALMQAGARGWDGSRPVRAIEELLGSLNG